MTKRKRKKLQRKLQYLNPLLPSVPYMARLVNILISIFRKDQQKISYERRDYESVDEKNPS